MALLTISGDPDTPWEEIANRAAQLLHFELVTPARLSRWIAAEFGEAPPPTEDKPHPRPPIKPGSFVVLQVEPVAGTGS